MGKICFGLLAHNEPDCLADLVDNIRVFAPGADIVLFNGGRDAHLADGLGIEVCPYSQPLGYERVAYYHYALMRWLNEERRDYDFLVTLDSDVLLIKPGLGDYLDRTMAHAGYMSVLFREIDLVDPWIPGRMFHSKWERVWQPIFGTRYPYGCFNPGQTFRREYAERLLQFPRLEELLSRIDRSSLHNLEELVWASLAVTLECRPRAFPETMENAVRYLKRHSPRDIRGWLADPDVYFIHPITMEMDAPERRLIRDLAHGQRVDFDAYQRAFETYQAAPPSHKRWRNTLVMPALSKLYNAYLRVLPE